VNNVTDPRAQALVSLSALTHNVRALGLERIDVSADAFGHGVESVVSQLRAQGISAFSCGRDSEVAALRELFDDVEVVRQKIDREQAIATYGLSLPAGVRLRPVMTLSSRVIAVKSIAAGGGVSYGYTWIAENDGFLALVGLGYADGFDRAWGNRIHGHVDGRSYPAVGRVAMDAHTISTGDDKLSVGDEVIYFGELAEQTVYASELASSVGGSVLAIPTNLGSRIARIVA
jgi:alanine racemase